MLTLPISTPRNGVAALLSMIYLVLFATLAVGFYASTSTFMVVADSDAKGATALVAAESGMDFTRYQLSQLKLPPNTSDTDLLAAIAAQLSTQLDGTQNMKGHTVAVTNGTIYLPSSNDWITYDTGSASKFRTIITQSANKLIVKAVGMSNSATSMNRAVQLTYQKQLKNGGVFPYGMASKGTILVKGGAIVAGAGGDATKGSIYSAMSSGVPLTIAGSSKISGDFSYGGGTPSFGSNATIAGNLPTSPDFYNHIHSGVAAPEWPTIDTSGFYKYCLKADGTPNYYTGSMGYNLTNVVLPPGNYSFGSGFSVQGVLYIKAPSTVKFGSVGTIRGVVVVENNPIGNLSTNTLSMAGKTTVYPIDTLPAGDPRFPPELRAMTGSFILAPNFDVSFAGAFDQVVAGSIIGGHVSFSSSAGGTVRGSIIALDPSGTPITHAADPIYFDTPVSTTPAGIVGASTASYVPQAATYDEVKP